LQPNKSTAKKRAAASPPPAIEPAASPQPPPQPYHAGKKPGRLAGIKGLPHLPQPPPPPPPPPPSAAAAAKTGQRADKVGNRGSMDRACAWQNRGMLSGNF
jgi:hypothetical protein